MLQLVQIKLVQMDKINIYVGYWVIVLVLSYRYYFLLSKTVYPEISGTTHFLLDFMSALVTFSNQPNQSRV